MKRVFLFCSLLLLSSAGRAIYAQPVSRALFPNLQGGDLLRVLVEGYKPATVLGYGPARDVMYGEIDLVNDSVAGVYSGHRLYLEPGEDPSQFLYRDGRPDGINCEHSWPRSKGADRGSNAFSDLHHLFPTRVAVNAARGNHPFGEVDDQRTERWFFQSEERSTPPGAALDQYSESGDHRFEPPEDRKGDIARAAFYFYTMYRSQADAADPRFFEIQRADFCRWHALDPVDEREYTRTWRIARYQDGKANPFVLDPSLAERTYCR